MDTDKQFINDMQNLLIGSPVVAIAGFSFYALKNNNVSMFLKTLCIPAALVGAYNIIPAIPKKNLNFLFAFNLGVFVNSLLLIYESTKKDIKI